MVCREVLKRTIQQRRNKRYYSRKKMENKAELNFEAIKNLIEKHEIRADVDLVVNIGKVAIKKGLKTTKNYNFIILAAKIIDLAIEEEKNSR